MASVKFIPKYCVFRSNYSGKYVRYVAEEDEPRFKCVNCDGTDIFNPSSKLRVKKAQSSSHLVHIRCCFSNKYFRRCREDSEYISAEAEKPEEDQSKWSCTLFKPIQVGDSKTTFRFQNVQLGNYLTADHYPYGNFLICSTPDSNNDLFTVINWESLVILPKYVVFKGNNGKYLRYRGENDDHHMEFGCDDIGATKVCNELFTNFDGSVRVKHDFNGKFWEATPNWIYPISNDSNSTSRTSFWPVKLERIGNKDNVIALKSLGNDRFCRKTNYGGTKDCLAAASWATTIDQEAHLEVEEPLVSRKIYNVDFHLGDIRVYKEQILVLASDETSNKSETQTTDSELTLEYEDSRTSTYTNSTSVKTGVEMEFSAGIPVIEGVLDVGLSSKFSVEFGKTYSWGVEMKKTNQLSSTIKVAVPPKTKVTVELVATKGVCDVPFSYAQRDTFTDGKRIITMKKDGVYTGSNYYGFNFKVKKEQISG